MKAIDDIEAKAVIGTIMKMMDTCIERVKKDVEAASEIGVYKATYQRIDKQWRTAVKRLEKEGKVFAKEDGFKNVCKNQLMNAGTFEWIFNRPGNSKSLSASYFLNRKGASK